MSITWIGLVELIIGVLLLFWSDAAGMLIFVLATSLLGGAAAVALPALGGSTIPPSYFALVFMVLRVFMPGSGMLRSLPRAVQLNLSLELFCLYGAVAAMILPRIFAGAMDLTPMRPAATADLYATSPLEFSSQNITTAVYLLGTMIAAVAAAATAARPKVWPRIVLAVALVTWVNIGLGVLQVVLSQVGHDDLLDVFRNGSYVQMEGMAGNFIRIKGLFPEASSYAAFTFATLVFVAEAWMRDLRPRLTGSAAIAATLILVFSTSSTALVSLGGYVLIICARSMLFPLSLPSPKALRLVLFVFIGLLICLIVAKLQPSLISDLGDVIRQMTVEKSTSDSGLQRGFWAKQGITAFKQSYGLGVGVGSFRSSSLLTAILGSSGIIGVVTFLVYFVSTFKPLRTSTYESARMPPEQRAGICCGWAAILGLIPAAISAPGPDPGALFAIFAGLSLGWRTAPILQAQSRATGNRPSLPLASPSVRTQSQRPSGKARPVRTAPHPGLPR